MSHTLYNMYCILHFSSYTSTNMRVLKLSRFPSNCSQGAQKLLAPRRLQSYARLSVINVCIFPDKWLLKCVKVCVTHLGHWSNQRFRLRISCIWCAEGQASLRRRRKMKKEHRRQTIHSCWPNGYASVYVGSIIGVGQLRVNWVYFSLKPAASPSLKTAPTLNRIS